MFIRRTIALIVLAPLFACVSTNIELEPIQSHEFEPSVEEQDLWRAASDYHAGLAESDLIFEDEELHSYLQSNLDVLTRLANIPEGSCRVVVVRDPYMNASMLPNGIMYVHSGLLARIENEAQLMTVFGHEIAHFQLRHGLKEKLYSERKRTNRIINRVAVGVLLLPLALSAVALEDLSDESMKAILEPQVAGYSRELESEADRYGFEVVSRAGYAPAESERLFRLLADETELLEEEINLSRGYSIRDPYYYARHPDLVERVEFFRTIRSELDPRCASEAGASDEPCRSDAGEIGAERYMSRMAPVVLEVVKADLKAGRRKSAIQILDRIVEFDPRSAEAWALLGEARGARGWDELQRDAAIDAFERAVALDPTLASAHRELGLLFRATGRKSDAVESLRRYVEHAPDALDRAIVEDLIEELE